MAAVARRRSTSQRCPKARVRPKLQRAMPRILCAVLAMGTVGSIDGAEDGLCSASHDLCEGKHMSGTATVRSVLGGLEWRLTLETSRSPPVNSSDPEREASIDFVSRCVHSPGCPMTTGPSCMQVYDETDETADIGCSLSVLPASATATDDALSRWRANAHSSGDQPLEALSALHGSEAQGTVFANGAAGGVIEFPQLGTPPGPAPAARRRERTLARRRLMRGRGAAVWESEQAKERGLFAYLHINVGAPRPPRLGPGSGPARRRGLRRPMPRRFPWRACSRAGGGTSPWRSTRRGRATAAWQSCRGSRNPWASGRTRALPTHSTARGRASPPPGFSGARCSPRPTRRRPAPARPPARPARA